MEWYPATSKTKEEEEEEEDSDTCEFCEEDYKDDVEPIATRRIDGLVVLDHQQLYELVDQNRRPEDDQWDVRQRVENLTEFFNIQVGFTRLRREILTRFDPRIGTLRYLGIAWEYDGLSAFFEGYQYWDAHIARRDFYNILFQDDRWGNHVVKKCGKIARLARYENKRPGILINPNTGPQLWTFLSWIDAIRLARVCRYTRRMYHTWVPLFCPDRGKENRVRWGKRISFN